MRNASWIVAVLLTGMTATTFAVAMVTFFQRRSGLAAMRMCLVVSVAVCAVAIGWSLGTRDAVGRGAACLGTALAFGSQAMFWWAVNTHRGYRPSAAFASTAPPVVRTTGPYAFVRHPFYAAYVLGFAGGAAFTEDSKMWLVPVWMLLVYGVAAYQEERVLLSSPMGGIYRDYRRRVGAFVPRARARGLRLSEIARREVRIAALTSVRPQPVGSGEALKSASWRIGRK
jgi:protein-S-isoprenylcysteine O-methyltransferase Ste14